MKQGNHVQWPHKDKLSLRIKACSTTWTMWDASNYSMVPLENCSLPLTAAQRWKICHSELCGQPHAESSQLPEKLVCCTALYPMQDRARLSWKGAEAIWFLSPLRAGGIRAPEYFTACSNGKVKGYEELMCAPHPTPGHVPHTKPEGFVQPSSAASRRTARDL